MKITIKRKYIYIKPTPEKDIPNGLCVKLFEAADETKKDIATTNIYKGQSKYIKPNKGTIQKPNYNTVKIAWLELNKK